MTMEPSVRLRNAVKAGNLAIVKRLVRRFPDLRENIDPVNGWSNLHYAGYHGHYLICVLLVQEGHDGEEISLTHSRATPLHLAASQNHEQTVHFLAQHIPRCLDWVNSDHETALMVAARYGHDPCINLLLDFGADINLPNRELNRPIHIAAAYGHIKTLRTLVDRNADVTTPNAEGWRPVQYCSTYQVQDYLQSLIHEKQESIKKQAFFNPKGSSTASIVTTVGSNYINTDLSSSQSTLTLQPQHSTTSPTNREVTTIMTAPSVSTSQRSNASAHFPQTSPSPGRELVPPIDKDKPLPSSPQLSPNSAVAPIPFAIPPRKGSVSTVASGRSLANATVLTSGPPVVPPTYSFRTDDSSLPSPVTPLSSTNILQSSPSAASMPSTMSSPASPRTRSRLLDVSVMNVKRD